MKKYFLTTVLVTVFTSLSWAQQLAFPTAEGYGKFTTGGRGGEVFEVTNLNDSGEGSLRAAVEASGPRTVVFRVSGTINLKSNLEIKKPFITIAGQTAPGDGITLRARPLIIRADDVIVRYIRVRLGDESGDATDGVTSRFTNNLILDHLSVSWSIDETMSVYQGTNTTVQWCIVAESLYMSNHTKGSDHGYGGIWGSNYSTFHHNLLAHHSSRNPRFVSGAGNTDYRNNVVYNWGFHASYGGEVVQPKKEDKYNFTNINMVANYYKPGPATVPGKRTNRFVAPWSRNKAEDYGKWYLSDNFLVGNPEISANNWKGGVQPQDGDDYIEGLKLSEPWPAMPINQQTAENAYHSVLENAGTSLPKRDTVDLRIIDEVRNGYATFEGSAYKTKHEVKDLSKKTGIIDSQENVGGWPELKSTPAPLDTDHDGMPDAWEIKNKLNPKNANDRNNIGKDGYTMLELYLNSIKN
ncbi:pectate lyase [Mariniflexile litorale]|uniref:Pectate lyase n=1 Tax=Mariniflexile litorale TaxID=3045158 RepID=A0AAU7EFY4_9FLAO|nr:pectate lyase [Mariniflexile sp. KMM 9835]MDQ8211735.1 pectate lyase [Mariniflexile sp. KMM 9835]